MTTRQIHFLSGLAISVFVALHLINHSFSLLGADKHIDVMNMLRPIYRNIFIETVLLLAVVVQIYSGFRLYRTMRSLSSTFFDKLQVWTGLYLAIFFVIHVGAVLVGRMILDLDTNFYFGVAGLNNFPANLFFIPYYSMAIISFFGHIASIHSRKMNIELLGLNPDQQGRLIFVFGILLTLIIMYGLTNHFMGVTIPPAYNILIGK